MTSATPTSTERTYRFGPLDKTGWLLGLGAHQCLALGGGLFSAGVLLQVRAPAALVVLPPLVAIVFAFAAWDGRTLHEWAPVITRHAGLTIGRRRRWVARVSLLSGSSADRSREASLPPFLAGLELLDGGSLAWTPATIHSGVGFVRDKRDGTLSATLRVRGRAFSLLERVEQERVVANWGDVLATFCTERRQVCRVRVTESAATAGVAEHVRFADDNGRDPVDSAPRRIYDELLQDAGPLSVGHDVLVTITVDPRRLRAGRDRSRDVAAMELLGEELRLLTARLEGAGLDVDPPLSTSALAQTFRRRLDPTVDRRRPVGSASLAELARAVSPRNAGPMACDASWGALRADGAWHRSYWVAEWPRLDVGPNWLEPLLLHAGGIRTFAVHYEPVPPSRSQRRVDQDSTRLATDEEQRSRSGFRIGARHRRAQAAVLEREAELVAGYAELEFAGFLTVTATDEEQLLRECAEYEQAAAQAGLELRALEGHHDLGFVCSLPIGRGLAQRRFA